MKEENKKRINKLIIPFTKRTLSFLTATTMLVTGTVGCKEDNDNKKDTSSLTNSVSGNELTFNDEELTIEDNIQSNTNEESNIEQSNNDQVSNNTSSNNNKDNSDNKNNQTTNNSNNNTSSDKNNQTNNSNNSNNNQSGSINSSIPSTSNPTPPSVTPQTPSTPTMPSSLTASNINDIEVFKHFATKFQDSINPSAISTTFKYTYNGTKYATNGDIEFQLALLLLNNNYVSNDLKKSLFGSYSVAELQRYASFIETIVYAVDSNKVDYNFYDLCVDKGLGQFLDEFTNEFKNASNGGSINKLEKILVSYFKTKNTKYYYGSVNPWVDYYIKSLSISFIFYLNDRSVVTIIQEECPTKSDYSNYVTSFYNQINSKTKIYIKE